MVDISNKSVLKVEKETRIYCLDCSSDSTLGELYDVICEMRSFVLNKMIEADKAEKEKLPETPPGE